MNPNNHRQEEQGLSSFHWLMLVLLVMLITGIGLSLYDASHPEATNPQTSSLRSIASAVEAGKIKSITVRGDLLIAYRADGKSMSAHKESSLSAFETLQLLGVSPETLANLPIEVEETTTMLDIVCAALPVLVFFLIYGVYFFSMKQRANSSGGPFSTIGRSNPRVLAGASTAEANAEHPKVTFQDVAGVESAKIELQEVVEFLKEPDKFTRLGARVPKGVLMAGPPGTGKTLLAKAVAGEAGVPFFSISGSEFVELYVGVGASRVRDLFARAREKTPSIIFVDEIDAVGRQRGARIASGNDEREQTLNQVLVEMDGFGTDTRVIVIAATNRPDILDPALLRPGRFDRKVVLDRPDMSGRQAILNVHTRGKPLAADVSIVDLAKLTPGFVGADLENLVNEAAILAARRNLDQIGRPEFQEAMERIIAGPERKSSIMNAQERQVIAFHEAGHAVVMHNLQPASPVHKVSIISRGMALGYTMPLPEGDRYLHTREAFEAEIVGLLGGRAAEEIIFEQVTTGAANDLERATRLARTMVTRYGFSSRLGLRTYGEEQEDPYLGSLGTARDYSEQMAETIDEEINLVLDTAYHQAKEVIVQKRSQLERLAQALLEHETVERAEFEALMA